MFRSLEDRFNSFMESATFTESIDRLLEGEHHERKKRADYLLFERKIIVELKTLKDDPSSKIDEEMDKHREREDFPLILGTVDLQSVLQCLPDGETINRTIFLKTTRSVEKGIRSANKQFIDTKEIFKLSGSVSLLVVLNENLKLFSPEVVLTRLSQFMRSSSPSDFYQENVNFVWFLAESHVAVVPHIADAPPSILLTSSSSDRYEWFFTLFEQLQRAWAEFNNLPFKQLNITNPQDITFRSTSSQDEA